jgi:hypothetical protein
MSMSERSQVWYQRIIDEVKSLRGVYVRHMADYDEVIPHLLMGEFADWSNIEYARGGRSPELATLLSILEAGMLEGPNEFKDAVATGYVENLGAHSSVLGILEPTLRKIAGRP